MQKKINKKENSGAVNVLGEGMCVCVLRLCFFLCVRMCSIYIYIFIRAHDDGLRDQLASFPVADDTGVERVIGQLDDVTRQRAHDNEALRHSKAQVLCRS